MSYKIDNIVDVDILLDTLRVNTPTFKPPVNYVPPPPPVLDLLVWGAIERGLEGTGNLASPYRGVAYNGTVGVVNHQSSGTKITFDQGKTWILKIPSTGSVDTAGPISFDEGGTSFIVGATGTFQPRCTNDNFTTTFIPTGLPTNTNYSGSVSVGGGVWLISATDGKIYRSVDNLASFNYLATVQFNDYFHDMYCDGVTIFAVGGQYNSIYTSTDGGFTWINRYTGFSGNYGGGVTNHNGLTIVTATNFSTNGAIYTSTDDQTFTLKQTGIPVGTWQNRAVHIGGSEWILPATGSTLIHTIDDFDTIETLTISVTAPVSYGTSMCKMGNNIVYLLDSAYALINPPITP